jgi:two-component system, OmpR family, heavy metal sensor histidine kinase CusS
MKPLSIRLKLTAWYFTVLLGTIAVFGMAAFLAMRKGIETSVDEGLRDQAEAIEKLMNRALPEGPEMLADGLREHSELRGEGNFSQVSDQHGLWIYRSPLMVRYGVPVPPASKPSIYDWQAHDLPLRVLVGEVSVGGKTYRLQVATPMDDFYDALNRFKWVVLLLSPVLLALASAGGYWMSRRALTPVDEITRSARNINSKNLSKRLKVPQSGDELQRLSETLNSMLERLEAAFKRITQFTADASHELRTPLALMRTTTEVSLRTSQTVSEYREAQAQTLEELEKTSTLVEQLMLLARADAGVETLKREPVNLVNILLEACRDGRILAETNQIAFREEIADRSVVVDGDSRTLHRLFLILIDNAVKYTSPGGLISVSLTRSDEFAVAEVRDTGVGIAAEDLPHIFERFYRADKARSREVGGVGLGLSIARWEAEAHGGEIEVESEPGQGSVFRVHLPLSEA